MNNFKIAFIASCEYDNLGIGYMSSILTESGFQTKTIDIHKRNYDILRILKKYNPCLVGFSVIFQYHLEAFSELISYLRKGGIGCHFTAGGHYASLKPEELFGFIPELDSIVRFEGEYSLLELARVIQNESDWREVHGIAFQKEHEIIFTPLRPIEKNIDKFPFPERTSLKKFAFEIPCATLIAGRGCTQNCSFCNEREFYRMAGGPLKRIRKPKMVVEEMKMLYTKMDCPVFLFLDDDFPVGNSEKTDWINEFCRELERTNLSGNILWKISCRVDEIDIDKFALMKKHGLFLVFIGIEDGTDNGLKKLHKHISVGQTLKAIKVLKELEIGIDYGFLLFQPSSSFETIKVNLDFLQCICGDGYMPVNFLKAMPYYSTYMEKELIGQNRLILKQGIRDYNFINTELDNYYSFISGCFSEWFRSAYGLNNQISWLRNYFLVFSRFYGYNPAKKNLFTEFTATLSDSNRFIVSTISELIPVFKMGKNYDGILKEYSDLIDLKHDTLLKKINYINDELYDIALDHAFRRILNNA